LLNFSKPFLPEVFARTEPLAFLDATEQRLQSELEKVRRQRTVG